MYVVYVTSCVEISLLSANGYYGSCSVVLLVAWSCDVQGVRRLCLMDGRDGVYLDMYYYRGYVLSLDKRWGCVVCGCIISFSFYMF